MITLRPHHLIDIIRNIGLDRSITPHPYGHAQHSVTKQIISDPETSVTFVLTYDDICRPCSHLTSNKLCDDILPQLAVKTMKQSYNDELDGKVFAILDLQPGSSMLLQDFLARIEKLKDELIPVCLHPGEDITLRRKGVEEGLKKLRKFS